MEPNALDDVCALELRLLRSEVRSDPMALESLLHPDFEEIGKSGRRWTRAEIIETLATEDPNSAVVANATDMHAKAIADGVVHVTYRTTTDHGEALRSSIWTKTTSGWQLVFHQGTAVPDIVRP